MLSFSQSNMTGTMQREMPMQMVVQIGHEPCGRVECNYFSRGAQGICAGVCIKMAKRSLCALHPRGPRFSIFALLSTEAMLQAETVATLASSSRRSRAS